MGLYQGKELANAIARGLLLRFKGFQFPDDYDFSQSENNPRTVGAYNAALAVMDIIDDNLMDNYGCKLEDIGDIMG